MQQSTVRVTWRSTGLAASATGTAVVALLTLRADLDAAPTARGWYAVADLAAGLAFPLAASRTLRSREWGADAAAAALAAAVGPLWLLGSLLPQVATLHQAALVLALLSFPRIRLRDPVRLVLAVTALGVAVVPVSQLTLSALFAATAIATAARPNDPAPTARMFPSLAAAGLAVSLAALWWDGGRQYGATHTTVRFVAYAGVLVAAATGYWTAVREMDRTREHLADVLLAEPSLAGLDGLAEVLRVMIGDATLTIRNVGEPAAAAGPLRNRRQRRVFDTTDAERCVREALLALRELTHAISPGVLAEEGPGRRARSRGSRRHRLCMFGHVVERGCGCRIESCRYLARRHPQPTGRAAAGPGGSVHSPGTPWPTAVRPRPTRDRRQSTPSLCRQLRNCSASSGLSRPRTTTVACSRC